MTTPHQAILQKNTRRNLIRTLEDFSDREHQEKYKQAVPFVHVPRELLAQWEEYSSLLKERRDWFIQSLTERELTAMVTFDAAVEAFPCDGRLPDVPEILDASDWVQLMRGASQLLVVLNSKRGGCEQGAAGCSRSGSASEIQQHLVPRTIAEITASPDFKLEHTTKGGARFYARDITPDIARSISEKSSDYPFLMDGKRPYLCVVIYEDKILDFNDDTPAILVEDALEFGEWSRIREAKEQ